MLRIENVSKKFYQKNEEISVLRNLSLSVKKGEVYGFLGANGAGKTTTVKIIAGLLFPDNGTVRIGKLSSTDPESRRLFGFMPEQPRFYQHLRTHEVLEFAGELFDIPNEITEKRIPVILKQVGLEQSTDDIVKNFSKGMNQRLAFAVALINDPDLLILDEPLDGLDPLGRLDFKKMIAEWKQQGKTVFFSTHILADVEELCDRVGIIAEGKLIKEGAPRQLLKGTKKNLEEYFVTTVRNHA